MFYQRASYWRQALVSGSYVDEHSSKESNTLIKTELLLLIYFILFSSEEMPEDTYTLQ